RGNATDDVPVVETVLAAVIYRINRHPDSQTGSRWYFDTNRISDENIEITFRSFEDRPIRVEEVILGQEVFYEGRNGTIQEIVPRLGRAHLLTIEFEGGTKQSVDLSADVRVKKSLYDTQPVETILGHTSVKEAETLSIDISMKDARVVFNNKLGWVLSVHP